MKFGISFANVGTFVKGKGAALLAQAAEEAGFDSLWTVEHILYPEGYESVYPYAPDGKMPGSGNNPIPDPLVWLGYAAAVTSSIRLATGISLLPERHPLTFAKEVATLDVLSGGRVTLGVWASAGCARSSTRSMCPGSAGVPAPRSTWRSCAGCGPKTM